MATELELKAVVPDPEALRARLAAAGATAEFRGRMVDRRFDRDGELTARDEVLRLRVYRAADGGGDAVLAWKGPTRRSAEGYKLREEIESHLALDDGDAPVRLLGALGYAAVHTIEREVEVYRYAGATLRLEWYPRMDVLIEVEGPPEAIERAAAVTGLPRAGFTADALTEFVRRYEERTGRSAALALDQLGGELPTWSRR